MSPKLLILAASGLLGATLVVAFGSGYILSVNPDKDRYPVRGFDVSHHNQSIDWSTVEKGDKEFVFIKATEGDDLQDPRLEENLDGARIADLAVGAYHYYSLRFTGESQAKNFIASVPKESITLPPVIDLEYSGNSQLRPTQEEFTEELKTYISLVKNHYGQEPILYTTDSFYRDYLKTDFSNFRFWMVDVFGEPNSDNRDFRFWQYSHRGHVKGITGHVDLNVFHGTREEFEKL